MTNHPFLSAVTFETVTVLSELSIWSSTTTAFALTDPSSLSSLAASASSSKSVASDGASLTSFCGVGSASEAQAANRSTRITKKAAYTDGF
jgi:hypothetical protein